MVKILYLWDKDKMRSVVAGKLREINITKMVQTGISRTEFPHYWTVRGWFNQDHHFYFGEWDTEEEARAFVDNLHLMVARSG
jgi:hypothetical protein